MAKMMDLLNKLVPEQATPGEMLRAFRKRDGLSLEQMKEITGLQVSNLSALENDRMPMTQHYAEIFAAALKIHPTVLLYPSGRFEMNSKLKEIERRAAKIRKHG